MNSLQTSKKKRLPPEEREYKVQIRNPGPHKMKPYVQQKSKGLTFKSPCHGHEVIDYSIANKHRVQNEMNTIPTTCAHKSKPFIQKKSKPFIQKKSKGLIFRSPSKGRPVIDYSRANTYPVQNKTNAVPTTGPRPNKPIIKIEKNIHQFKSPLRNGPKTNAVCTDMNWEPTTGPRPNKPIIKTEKNIHQFKSPLRNGPKVNKYSRAKSVSKEMKYVSNELNSNFNNKDEDGDIIIESKSLPFDYRKNGASNIAESHQKRSNKTRRDIKCSECYKRFKYPSCLVRHIKSHHEERDVQCTLCTKLFKSISSRNVHFKSEHEGIRYPCHFCNKIYTQNSARNNHEKMAH